MNKLFLMMTMVAVLFGSCSKDKDEDRDDTGNGNGNGNNNNKDLVTPELASMTIASVESFSGALTVTPCDANSSIYFGNYNSEGNLSALNATYIISDGSIAISPMPVRLPVGGYNFLYWGAPKNGQADSTYDHVSISEPGLRIGTDLSQRYYTLRKESALDTTYNPVYDLVYAAQPMQVGTDKMQATLKRAVAGLKVTLTNHGGAKMNPSIASTDVHIGGIALNMNYYSAEPSDFTKTVAFPLAISSDSLAYSTNSTVMVFPSGNSPLLTILLTLKNGQVKTYSKPLTSSLTAGNRLNLNITLGDLIIEEGGSNTFEVENWTESSETIVFP